MSRHLNRKHNQNPTLHKAHSPREEVQGKHEGARKTGRHTGEHKNDLAVSLCEKSINIGSRLIRGVVAGL